MPTALRFKLLGEATGVKGLLTQPLYPSSLPKNRSGSTLGPSMRGWSGSEKVAWLFLFKHKPCLKITTMDKLKEHIFSLISKRRSLCLQFDFISDFQTLCFYDGVWVIPQLVWFFVIKTLEILQVKSFRLNFWLTALGDLRGFRGTKIQIFGFAVEATRFSVNAQLFSCSHSLIIFKVTSCPLAEKWLNFMKVS